MLNKKLHTQAAFLVAFAAFGFACGKKKSSSSSDTPSGQEAFQLSNNSVDEAGWKIKAQQSAQIIKDAKGKFLIKPEDGQSFRSALFAHLQAVTKQNAIPGSIPEESSDDSFSPENNNSIGTLGCGEFTQVSNTLDQVLTGLEKQMTETLPKTDFSQLPGFKKIEAKEGEAFAYEATVDQHSLPKTQEPIAKNLNETSFSEGEEYREAPNYEESTTTPFKLTMRVSGAAHEDGVALYLSGSVEVSTSADEKIPLTGQFKLSIMADTGKKEFTSRVDLSQLQGEKINISGYMLAKIAGGAYPSLTTEGQVNSQLDGKKEILKGDLVLATKEGAALELKGSLARTGFKTQSFAVEMKQDQMGIAACSQNDLNSN